MCPSPYRLPFLCFCSNSYLEDYMLECQPGSHSRKIGSYFFFNFILFLFLFLDREKIFKWHETDREEQMSAVYFPWLDFNWICIRPYLFSLYRIRESGLTKPSKGQCLFWLMDDGALRLGSSKEKFVILSRDSDISY